MVFQLFMLDVKYEKWYTHLAIRRVSSILVFMLSNEVKVMPPLSSTAWIGIGVIVTFIGVLVTFLNLVIPLLTKKQVGKQITYEIVSSTPVLSIGHNVKGKVQSFYKNKLISSIHQIIIKIKNTGEMPITLADYALNEPIKLDFGINILEAEVTESQPNSIKTKANTTLQINTTSVTLSPLFLGKQESFVLQVLLEEPNDQFINETRFIDVTQLTKTKIPSKILIKNNFLMLVLLLIIAPVIFTNLCISLVDYFFNLISPGFMGNAYTYQASVDSIVFGGFIAILIILAFILTLNHLLPLNFTTNKSILKLNIYDKILPKYLLIPFFSLIISSPLIFIVAYEIAFLIFIFPNKPDISANTVYLELCGVGIAGFISTVIIIAIFIIFNRFWRLKVYLP